MGISKTDLFSKEQNDIALAAKAFANPARVAIIQHLMNAKQCVNSDLVQELGLAQATISQHLRELKDIGIIQGTIEGSRLNYCINPVRWKSIQDQFNDLFNLYINICESEKCC